MPLPRAVGALHALSRRLAVVAAVSGRSAGFLAERLELARYRSPLRAIGLHGLEEASADGRVTLRPGAAAWRGEIEAVREELKAAVPAGARVEDKGLGITVHWRSVTGPPAELRSVAERADGVARAVAARHGLEPRPGKASVELAPPLGVDKGTVVTELCGGLRTAAFLGDDTGDLLAFAALERLQLSGATHGLKVAVVGAEAPAEMFTRADLVLQGPEEAVAFLTALEERLERS